MPSQVGSITRPSTHAVTFPARQASRHATKSATSSGSIVWSGIPSRSPEQTSSQFGVLEALMHVGPLCQRELGAKILKSSGNITMVIDNLEKRGLVERRRDTGDRRYVTVYLTASGKQLIATIFPRHMERIKDELRVLSSSDQQNLGKLCRTIGLGQTS